MLNVLLHAELGDVVAVVTRWYGGVKLGTGGLARAYGGAVVEALRDLPTVERVDVVALIVTVAYPAIGGVQQLFAALEVTVTNQQFGESVRFELDIDRAQEATLRERLADLTRGEARVELATPSATP